MGEQGKWQLAERLFAELEAEQLDLMAREAATADAAAARRQHDLAAASGSADSAAAPAVSAFPGMAKQLPTEVPGGVGSNPEAIAAAAAAVAAMAAAHQQQLAALAAAVAAEEDSEGLQHIASAAAEQVLGTPRAGKSAEGFPEASLAATADSPFSYFSGSSAAKLAVSPDSVAAAGTALDAFSLSVPQAAAASAELQTAQQGGAWTNDNAAVRGLSFHLDLEPAVPAALPVATAGATLANVLPAPGLKLRPLPRGRGPVNEVVCGALMLAYERVGKWAEAVGVLDRARVLGE